MLYLFIYLSIYLSLCFYYLFLHLFTCRRTCFNQQRKTIVRDGISKISHVQYTSELIMESEQMLPKMMFLLDMVAVGLMLQSGVRG